MHPDQRHRNHADHAAGRSAVAPRLAAADMLHTPHDRRRHLRESGPRKHRDLGGLRDRHQGGQPGRRGGVQAHQRWLRQQQCLLVESDRLLDAMFERPWLPLRVLQSPHNVHGERMRRGANTIISLEIHLLRRALLAIGAALALCPPGAIGAATTGRPMGNRGRRRLMQHHLRQPGSAVRRQHHREYQSLRFHGDDLVQPDRYTVQRNADCPLWLESQRCIAGCDQCLRLYDLGGPRIRHADNLHSCSPKLEANLPLLGTLWTAFHAAAAVAAAAAPAVASSSPTTAVASSSPTTATAASLAAASGSPAALAVHAGRRGLFRAQIRRLLCGPEPMQRAATHQPFVLLQCLASQQYGWWQLFQ